ncbi:unnamed protein product [Clonostachys rosea f. rosea IK726]|uniref:Uncharacterized protein n=1 Tax=Clonostachys rosea f. rosea IK726 TaxID=1349383 RepID=A0ACA9UUP3_BIOOC|nr:unnamed protein product [Clonostachys rosea f. rosea IK726]
MEANTNKLMELHLMGVNTRAQAGRPTIQSPVTQPTGPSIPGGYAYGGSSQPLQSNPATPLNPIGAYYSSTVDVQSQPYAANLLANTNTTSQEHLLSRANTLSQMLVHPAYTYPQTGSAAPGQPPLTDPNLNVASSPPVANFSYESQYPNTGAAVPISQGLQSTPDGGYMLPGTDAALPGLQPSVPETGYRYPGTAAVLSGPQTGENPLATTNVIAQDQQQQQQQPLEHTSVDIQPSHIPAPSDGVTQVNSRIESALQEGNVTVTSDTPVVAPKPSTRIHAALLDPSPADSPESPPSVPQSNSRIEAFQEPIYAPGPITAALNLNLMRE